jgi:hypothetical protein
MRAVNLFDDDGKIVKTIEYEPSRDAPALIAERYGFKSYLDYDTIGHAREAGQIIVADSYSGFRPLPQKTIR